MILIVWYGGSIYTGICNSKLVNDKNKMKKKHKTNDK